MANVYRLLGYDQHSRPLVEAYEIPPLIAPTAKMAAGMFLLDAEFVEARPLTPCQAREVAKQIGRMIAPEQRDYYLDPPRGR